MREWEGEEEEEGDRVAVRLIVGLGVVEGDTRGLFVAMLRVAE